MPPVIRLNSRTTTATVTNTTAETALTSVSLPAYLFDTGRAVRSWAFGSLTAVSTGSVTVRTYSRHSSSTGFGTLLGSAQLSPSTSASARWWGVSHDVVATSTAGQRHRLQVRYTAPSTGVALRSSTVELFGYSTSGLTHDKSIVLTVTAQWSAASTGRSIDLRTGWTEAVR